MTGPLKLGRSPGWDLLRTTLAQIPTVFGRLVYLSSLFDANSSIYRHELFARMFGTQDADRVLRQQHREVFSDWLDRSLEEQKNDLDEYLAGMRLAAGQVVQDLTQMNHYRALIPPAAREVERQLYLTDLETLLELLKLERGAAFWNSEA
jgi:hypothetical protein